MVLPEVDQLVVRRLGVDEHRYRTVRFFRDPDTHTWRRFEPWMSTPTPAKSSASWTAATPRLSGPGCRRAALYGGPAGAG